jgi:hypothetical protein
MYLLLSHFFITNTRKKKPLKKGGFILVHGFSPWLVCSITMGLWWVTVSWWQELMEGRLLTSSVHALTSVFFIVLSAIKLLPFILTLTQIGPFRLTNSCIINTHFHHFPNRLSVVSSTRCARSILFYPERNQSFFPKCPFSVKYYLDIKV